MTARGARLAVAAPRGHAKSTIVSCAYLLWCLCYGLERYILLISDSGDQANDLLSHAKEELTGNPLLGRIRRIPARWHRTDRPPGRSGMRPMPRPRRSRASSPTTRRIA